MFERWKRKKEAEKVPAGTFLPETWVLLLFSRRTGDEWQDHAIWFDSEAAAERYMHENRTYIESERLLFKGAYKELGGFSERHCRLLAVTPPEGQGK